MARRCLVCWWDFADRPGPYCSPACASKVEAAGGPHRLADQYEARARTLQAVHESAPRFRFDRVANVALAQAGLLRALN